MKKQELPSFFILEACLVKKKDMDRGHEVPSSCACENMKMSMDSTRGGWFVGIESMLV